MRQAEGVSPPDPCRANEARELWDDDAREFAPHLDRLGVGSGGWEVAFRCRLTGVLWLEDWPRSGEHGGGPQRLRRIEELPDWITDSA
jgi:hypothetical protein